MSRSTKSYAGEGPIPSATDWSIDGEIKSFIKGIQAGHFTILEVEQSIIMTPAQLTELRKDFPSKRQEVERIAAMRAEMLSKFRSEIERGVKCQRKM